MKVIVFIALALAFASAQPIAIAVMRGTGRDPTIVGTVIFSLNSLNNSQIDVTASYTGITQNLGVDHGMHVHYWGDISDSLDALAMGGHWKVAGEVHSCPPNETRESGDMGNWFVALDGTLTATKTFDKLALTGVNSIIGRGVVLHNLTDLCNGTNGFAGARIAQGVIGIYNSTGNTASNGLPRTTTGIDVAVCNLMPIVDTEVIRGYGIISQYATGGINILVQINNITANATHAAHIHANGDLRSGDTMGGHWNPLVQRHGMYGYPEHHMGDLGNIAYFQNLALTVAAANFSQANASFNVVGGAYNVLGHGMVIHASRDDCSNPIGNSGARYAICVWGLSSGNFTYLTPAPPASVATAYDAVTVAACNAQFNITSTTTGDLTTSSASIFLMSALTILGAMLF